MDSKNFLIIIVDSFKDGILLFLGIPVNEDLQIPLTTLISLFLLIAGLAGLAISYKKYQSNKKGNALLIQSNQQWLLKIKHLQELNNELKTADEKLKNSNATKDKFFSIIAHDLKGPLNSLTGLLQLLIKYADSFSKEELKDFGKNMNKSVNNLLDLLENLLHWSQTQSGMIEYCPEEICLHELVHKTVNLLAPTAENKNIHIEVNVKEGLLVVADKNMISFTLRNLVSNAIKFTNKGGGVSIYSYMHEDSVEIAIADTGIGMNLEDVQKLFRIDKCYTTNGTANEIGTGLGLILCNEFIDKNKGKITVESKLNEGSVFRFSLPIVSTGEPIPVIGVY